MILAHPKTNSSIFSYQTLLEFLWSDETKKLAFYQQTLKMGLVNTGIKKIPYVYNAIYCCILYVVGLYFCWRSWTSCLDTWHHGFYQTPTDTNL